MYQTETRTYMRPRPRPRLITMRPRPRPRPKKWSRDHAGLETLTSLNISKPTHVTIDRITRSIAITSGCDDNALNCDLNEV